MDINDAVVDASSEQAGNEQILQIKRGAEGLLKQFNALSQLNPNSFAVGPCKNLQDLIHKWTTKEPNMEEDVSRFYESVFPILQMSHYRGTESCRSLLVVVLRCVWTVGPHLGNPGRVVLSLLQGHVLEMGGLVGSLQVGREALNVIFAIWPRWGVQVWGDGMLNNLGTVLCLTLRTDPQSNLHHAGKIVQAIVKTILVRLDRKDLIHIEGTGVHKSFRQLLFHYDFFTWQQFQAVILGCGLMEDAVNRSSDYLLEGVLEMLLFAAREFAVAGDDKDSSSAGEPSADNKCKVHWDIWTLLSLLCQQNQDASATLFSSGALDVVVSILSHPTVERAPVYQFLASLMSNSADIKSSILEGSTVLADVNAVLTEGATSPFIDHNAIKAGEIFAILTDRMTVNMSSCIVQQQLLAPLILAAKQHPQFLAEQALQCIKNLSIVGTSRPGRSKRHNPGTLLDLEEAEVELAAGTRADTIFAATYKDGYHTFIQSMLESETLTDSKIVGLLYQTIASFTYHCPLKVSHIILTEGFLSAVVKASKRHLSVCKDSTVASLVANAVSSITFNCLSHPVPTQRLRAAGVHELVVHCLVSQPLDVLPPLKWLMTFSNLVYCYRLHLKDMKCMFDCNAHKVLVATAIRHGTDTAVGDEIDRCLLNWTYDKESSDRLGKESYASSLIPLLEHRYAQSLRRAVVLAIGNIAISGQKTKLAVLECGVHIVLLEHIRERQKNAEVPTYLSACCRLLHIISSSDTAKLLLLNQNCIKLMIDLALSHPGVPELEWRPLGAISAVCFLPVACRHHLFSPELKKFLSTLLKSANNPRVMGYGALILLALAEEDSGLVQVVELDVEDNLRSALSSSISVALFGDLKRWGNIVLEKLLLSCIKLHTGLFGSLDIPPLPDLHPSCATSVNECLGRAGQDGDKYSSFVPAGPDLTKSDCDQLLALGRNPYEIFRVGRLFGSTNGLCSNCDKDDSSSELVMRPHSLSPVHYQELISMGWYRRGGVKLFRFHNVHSMDCCDWETRVIVKDFSVRSHKSFQKTIRRMPKDLEVQRRPAYFNPEAYNLYNTYHVERYDKPTKSQHSYVEHVVNSPLRQQQNGQHVSLGTFHEEYRLKGKLVAVSVLDVVPKGMVSIYMWYDLSKEISKYSFGVYSALKEIESIQERQRTDPSAQHYYLQGWNEHNRRLKYKGDYEPGEFYAPCITDHWVPLKEGVRDEKKRVMERLESQLPKSDNDLHEVPVSSPMDVSNNSSVSCSKDKPKEKPPPLRSIVNDRVGYERDFGPVRVDDLVVCLNRHKYMTFGNLKAQVPLNQAQRELMEMRFEEYILAVGGTLSSQMVVDLLVLPVSAH